MLKIDSDGTIGGTEVTVDGKRVENIKSVTFEVDPENKAGFPTLKISAFATEKGNDEIEALVNCAGKRFKLEVGE